jgi:hypothetical protein
MRSGAVGPSCRRPSTIGKPQRWLRNSPKEKVMTMKTAGNGHQMRDIRAAWRHTKTTLHRAENSLGSLIKANNRLLGTLGDAGSAAAKKAVREFNAAIRGIEKRRGQIQRQFSKLIRH